jgi:hypothetical protein
MLGRLALQSSPCPLLPLTPMAIATFANGVLNIVVGSAQKEVIYVAAAWSVATMQNPQSVWNWTTM